MLTPQQSDLLARLRAANKAAGAPFATLGHWEGVRQTFDAWFAQYGIGCVEEQPYNSHFASYPPDHPAYAWFVEFMGGEPLPKNAYADACRLLEQVTWRKDRWGVASQAMTALPQTAPRRIVVGRPVSWDVLISLDSILCIASVYPRILTDPCLVVDLGAGWGRFGFVLKQLNPRITYVIYDLPESLLLSSTYLPTIMAGVPFHFYDDTRGKPVERDGGVWCLPAQDLALLPDGAADVFANMASFQEMTPEYVDLYSAYIERKVRGVFYSLQLPGCYFWNRWPIPDGSGQVSYSDHYIEYTYRVGE